MALFQLFSFLNVTLGLVSNIYNSTGHLSIDKACSGYSTEVFKGVCLPSYSYVKVDRHILTKDDRYYLGYAKATNREYQLYSLHIGTYDLFGSDIMSCGARGYALGLHNGDLELVLNYCRKVDGQKHIGEVFQSCRFVEYSEHMISGIVHSIPKDLMEEFSPIGKVPYFGIMPFRTECADQCSTKQAFYAMDAYPFYNIGYWFPLCADKYIPLCYSGRTDPCPLGYEERLIKVHSYMEGFESGMKTVCKSGEYIFPAWYSGQSEIYDTVVKPYIINVPEYCGRFSRSDKSLVYSRFGFRGTIFSGLKVITLDGIDYLTTDFCVNYSMHHYVKPLVFERMRKSFICTSSGCLYKGFDVNHLHDICTPKLIVKRHEALISSFSFINTLGTKVGAVPYDFDGNIIQFIDVFSIDGFYVYSLSHKKIQTLTVMLVHSEEEWYMKLLHFVADDILRECLSTVFKVLFSAISACLSFIIDVGGCCFRQFIFVCLDSVILLLLLLPNYTHLTFILGFTLNAYIQLVYYESCCFRAYRDIAETIDL
uniref:61 kDa protein n=1 Tax=Citrus leprosis virus C TaxID=347219 RepID=Q15GA1_9VIRU|nr:61 kDa protein [Citrus leprosis virus C]